MPWDLFWASRLDHLRKELQGDLPKWLTAIAEIEAAVSLAEFNDLHADTCLPRWLEEDCALTLQAEDLRHPLVPRDRSVGNPILMDSSHACLLITGSNMSGKSTFLRAVGVNILLARAGARAMAETFEVKNCAVRTCLRITDSITDQISSFYAEVQELKAILDQAQESSAQPDQPVLIYLIDEIFRGTNNRERLQGSRAYIREMLGMKRAFGLIATHDLELAELSRVNSSLKNLHFHETIEGGKMSFDYRIAQGPSPSTNALKVMRLAGLPVTETN